MLSTEVTLMGKSNGSRRGCGCFGGGVFGSVGAVLAAILSWQVNHSILGAACEHLAGNGQTHNVYLAAFCRSVLSPTAFQAVTKACPNDRPPSPDGTRRL